MGGAGSVRVFLLEFLGEGHGWIATVAERHVALIGLFRFGRGLEILGSTAVMERLGKRRICVEFGIKRSRVNQRFEGPDMRGRVSRGLAVMILVSAETHSSPGSRDLRI